MKITSLATKTVKEITRNRRNLLLSLGLPVAFMLIFGLAFGGDRDETTYDVVLLDRDPGAASDAFVKQLGALSYASGKKMFTLTNATSESEGVDAVKRGDATALVEIPAGFTGAGKATVTISGDPSNAGFQTASGIIDSVVARFNGAQRLTTARETVASSDLSAFDYIAPGLMVFAIINMAPQAAALLAREVENHTLTRLRLTRLRPTELLAGVSLGQLVISLVAVLLMFAAAALMGFHFQGVTPLLLALLIATVAALAVMGMGMIIAAFAKRQDHAAGIGVLVAVPGSFLSGAFFPIPAVDLFTVGGRVVQIYDILPTTHAVRAMRKVLTFGQGLPDVASELTALLVLSAVFFAVGVMLYKRQHLRPT